MRPRDGHPDAATLLRRLSRRLSGTQTECRRCIPSGLPTHVKEILAIVERIRPGRETIFQAALMLFYRHGYDGTSVRDIAKASGTTPAAMYHYYESKQALLFDIISRFMNQSIEATQEAIDQTKGNPAKQLFAAARSHVLWNASDVVSSFVVNSEIRSLDPVNRRLNISQRDELQRMFDAVIENGASEGTFAAPWPLEASRAVVTMCTSVARWYKSSGPLSPEEIADRYGHMALALVEARPGPGTSSSA